MRAQNGSSKCVELPLDKQVAAADFCGCTHGYIGPEGVDGQDGHDGRDGQDTVFPDDRIIALEHSLAALETQQQTLLILAEAQRQQLSSLKKDFEIQVGAEAIRGF